MLKEIDPQNHKYNPLYIQIAEIIAQQSYCERRKVGAVIVLPTGLLAVGYNGTPAGFDNVCEWRFEDGKGCDTGKTKPEVIHAERNALDKLTRQGVSAKGATLFVTCAPCLECAKSIAQVGIKEVHYRDLQNNIDGLDFLSRAKIPTYRY